MWICAWTLNHGCNVMPDHWTIHQSEAEAKAALNSVLTLDNLHCAAYGPIKAATEPQWLDA